MKSATAIIRLDKKLTHMRYRTSNSLNANRFAHKNGQKKVSNKFFSMENVVCSALELSAKWLFILGKYRLKIWVENSGSAI